MNLMRRQSPLLKIFGGLALIVVSAFAEPLRVGGMMALTGAFFLLDTSLLIDWLRAIAKLTVFILSYLLAGWLFHVTADAQIRFLLRLGFLLQISVWWVRTIRIEHLHGELRRWFPGRRTDSLRIFLNGLLIFIPMLAREFREQLRGRKVRFAEGLDILEQTFLHVGQRIREVEAELVDLPPLDVGFAWPANVLLLVFVLGGTVMGLWMPLHRLF